MIHRKTTRGRYLYEVPDAEAYRRYWMGRKPSNRELVEEWLTSPDATMYEVTKRHGKISVAIQMHISSMVKQAVIIRRKEQ